VEAAIWTAVKGIGYNRRTSHKKEFSDDPHVIAERLAFTHEGITWSRYRLQRQMFSDEVWTVGGAHTDSWVTVKEDGSDGFLVENLTHSFSKAPA
jgi:hypothetical protein